MELNLIDDQGKATSTVAASDTAFGREYNEALVHQLVTAYLSNARSATRMQKDRGDVKHSTKNRGGRRARGAHVPV
jgi:large subunit ribosomal protein L4